MSRNVLGGASCPCAPGTGICRCSQMRRLSVAETTQTFAEYRNRLDAVVTAFSLFIRDLCPEAQLEISFVRYEDEDAHIWITLPSTLTEEEREEIANRIAERSLDLLIAEGFLILAGIEESEQVTSSALPQS